MLHRLFLLLSVFLSCVAVLHAQTADEGYARPLPEVLKDIEQRFSIRIKSDKSLTEGKVLKHADWRIVPWSAEESLKAVLAPFDYTAVRQDGKTYKIKEFEYARRTPEEGKLFLDYLAASYPDRSSWEERKASLIACFPQALRLSPLPDRPDSKVIVSNKRKYRDYTVENFAIETLPGIYVCGSLYRPAKMSRKQKYPVMLNPNGHWGGGRYREDQQYRCAMLARMGVLAASWDLFAWGESCLQFDSKLHRLSAAQSIQTLNAIRILDYLLSLPEADGRRVGITGGSGGGSMTMMVAAIDPRITLSIPVVMLSSHFAGGCPCESGMPTHLCGKRTNNAEVAALFAPRPQLIVSDGQDWTATVPDLEFPFVKRIYDFYGAGQAVENAHFPEEGHTYGANKRQAVYRFVAREFALDVKGLVDEEGNCREEGIVIEPEEKMYVFGLKGENLPANAIKGKDALYQVLRASGILTE